MERDAGCDARAAVGDERAVRQLRKRLVPGRSRGARDPAGWVVDLVRLAAPAVRGAGVDERQRGVGEAARELLRRDGVAAPLPRDELGRLDLLLAGEQPASPDLDPAEQDRAVVVAEVPQKPPQPLRSPAASVRDDESPLADACPARRNSESLGRRERVAPRVRDREIREVSVDVQERRSRDVSGEIELSPARGVPELPPTVDELVPHVPTSVERRSSQTTSRQTPRDSPIPRRTPTSRNPHASWSLSDASFSGKTPAVSVQ